MKRWSKQWWRLNRQLLNKKAKLGSIPPLRENKEWISDPKEKANLFAKTFAGKAQIPEEAVDTPYFGRPDTSMDEFICIRSRYTAKLFRELDAEKATGHDKISAAILKRIGKFIAVPFTRICRRLLHEGCWPKAWRYHLVVPIFKKDVAFAAGNYRGVHLTPVLSKVAEKIIGKTLQAFLQTTAFGKNQWAFTPGLGSRDLVTKLIMEWILAICSGKKVGAYLSDISGAFDKVCKEYLLSKLNAAGVGSVYLNFLDAYLSPRQGQVVVEGEFSDLFEIADSVFQGTVLGPCLWNTFLFRCVCASNVDRG